MAKLDINKYDLDKGFSCKNFNKKHKQRERLFKRADKQIELIKSGVITSKPKRLPIESKKLNISDVEIESLKCLCKQKGIDDSLFKFTIKNLFSIESIQELTKPNYSILCNLINESKNNLDFKNLINEII